MFALIMVAYHWRDPAAPRKFQARFGIVETAVADLKPASLDVALKAEKFLLK